MVKSWNINAIVERNVKGRWLQAKIVGISPANRTLRLVFTKDDIVENDVDFDDVRFIEEDKRETESNGCNASNILSLKRGDLVERDIDGVSYKQNILFFS
jgi:hypothetical protein